MCRSRRHLWCKSNPTGLWFAAETTARTPDTASITCGQAVQDYVPPQTAALATWLDVGDSQATTTRAGETFGLAGRPADAAVSGRGGSVTPSLFIETASAFAISRQNDRSVVNFGRSSSGLQGTWGPFGTTGSWTLMIFLKVDQPVDDYGTTYVGTGQPMCLVSSPTLGLSIWLPRGGAVPTAAAYSTANPTGRIDGVSAGVPWDVPFVNRWRQLCVQNNAATQVRSVYVDGWFVETQAASTFTVPAASPLIVGANCPMALAELLVWDGVGLSPTDMRTACDAQRVKWGVTVQENPIVTTAPPATLVVPAALSVTPMPPAPDIWLDSTRAVYVDSAANTPAKPFTRVRVWKDSGRWGNHCTFATQCNAVYHTGPIHPGHHRLRSVVALRERINAKLPVVRIASGPGTFAFNPLQNTSTTGYTVVAVWRTIAAVDGGGGHPLSASAPTSVLGDAGWKERLGTEMACWVTPHPATALQGGTVVLGYWERTPDGQSAWRLNTLDGTGGVTWTGTLPVATLPDWQVGSSGRGLELAQLMVWRRVLTSAERGVLATWFNQVWGMAVPLPGGTPSASNAIPSAVVPSPSTLVMWLDATSGLYASAQMQSPSSVNGPVAVWCDRTANQCNVTLTAAQCVQNTGMPYVAITGAGTLPAGKRMPLAGTGPGHFCIVAVFRMVTTAAGGGHPYNVGGGSVLSATTWTEFIATSLQRDMPVPSGIASGAGPVCAYWMYDGAVLTFGLGSVAGAHGYRWSAAVTNLGTAWTAAQDVVIGTAGKQLQLAELLVWSAALTVGERTALDAYLGAKWDLPTYASPVLSDPLPVEASAMFPTSNITPCGLPNNPRLVLKVGNVQTYNGPVFRLQRSADSALADFFERDDTLVRDDNGAPQPLAVWKGASTVRIHTWYDQSGNKRNAVQADPLSMPGLDWDRRWVDFRATKWFALPDATIPGGNLPFSFAVQHGRIDTLGQGAFLSSGPLSTSTPGNRFNHFYFGNADNNRLYLNSWYFNDIVANQAPLSGSIVSTMYNQSTHVLRWNGSIAKSRNVTTARIGDTGNNCLGCFVGGGVFLNGDLRFVAISNDGMTSAQMQVWETTLSSVPTGLAATVPTPLVYDESSVYNVSNALTTTNGTVLGQWQERTGNGPPLVPFSVATAPAFKWTTPCYGGVRFNGAHCLQCTSGAPSFFTGATWFVVMTLESSLGVVVARNASTHLGWHYYCSSGSYVLETNGGNTASGICPAANTRFVFGLRCNPAALSITTWANNANRSDVPFNGTATDSPYSLIVGSGYSSNGLTANVGSFPLRGVIHALVIYPAVLADADVAVCFGNLRHKYAC